MINDISFKLINASYFLYNEKLEKAYQELESLRLKQKKSDKKISKLEQELASLKEQLKLRTMRKFGKSSDSSSDLKDLKNNSDKKVLVKSHSRKKKTNGRTVNTNNLPKYQIIHDLLDNEKTCSCCSNLMIELKPDISEKIEIIPARYYVIEHVCKKYACRSCQTIKMSPKPLAPIPKSIAGGSFITDIIIDKYQRHLPLYRQSKSMKNLDLDISDKTLANIISKVGEGLLIMYDGLWSILNSSYLQVDETPVKLLKPEKKGYLWAYFTPLMGKGLVVFEMSETRKGEVANSRLEKFNGILQTDAYSGYNKLRNREGIVGIGCLSHIRRKFKEAIKITSDPNGIAQEMIERLKPLYALESKMRDMKIDFRTRKRLRQKIASPIIKNIHKWLKSISGSVPPKSAVGNAISYALKQWKPMSKYLNHGYAEIDTNLVENKIREIAVGKKNWLFIGHKESGKIHALFYSLIISSVLNNLNPRVYIHYLVSKIHDLRKGIINPIDLLPHTISHSDLQEFADKQMALAKKIFDSS